MQFNLRDLLWLMVVAGLAVGWWCDHHRDDRTKISGVVTDKNNSDLVEISLGSDDGLKNGHIVEVRRGATYFGEGVARRMGPGRAVLQMRTRKRISIRKGDSVIARVKL